MKTIKHKSPSAYDTGYRPVFIINKNQKKRMIDALFAYLISDMVIEDSFNQTKGII